MSNLDKYFRDPLQNTEVTPSDKVWERIQQSGVIGQEKEKGLFPLWSKVAAAAVLLVGLFTTAYMRLQSPDIGQQLPPIAAIDDDNTIKDESVEETKQLTDTNDDLYLAEGHTDRQTIIAATDNTDTNKIDKKNNKARQVEKEQSKTGGLVYDKYQNVPTAVLAVEIQPVQYVQQEDQNQTIASLERAIAFKPPIEKPLFRVNIDPNDLLEYAYQEDVTTNDSGNHLRPGNLRNKLVEYAEGQFNNLADASGLRRLSRVNEIEIIY